MTDDVVITKEMVIAAGGDPNDCEFIQSLKKQMERANEVAENLVILQDFVCFGDIRLYKPTINHLMHQQPILAQFEGDLETRLRITAYILSFDGEKVRDQFAMTRLKSGGFGYDMNRIYQDAFEWTSEIGDDVAVFELVMHAMNFDKMTGEKKKRPRHRIAM